MTSKKKQKRWLKFRHRIVRNILYVILYPYSVIRYGIKIDKFKEQGKRPYLILLNHQTPFDQFFVGISFKKPIYYPATEDLFSNGFISKVIKFLIAPIPIKKQTTDVTAVMNCLRVARQGGTICIAPEGNRTYSGKTEYMNPAIVPLAKKLGLPIALYRIEGGYGAEPRWSDVIRRGKMHSYVYRVIEPDEYKLMSDDELYNAIKTGLYVNEAVADITYKSNKKAEYLERAIYVCPYCSLSEFESSGNVVECKKCHKKIAYNDDKTLSGVGFEFPFKFVNDWYMHQCKVVADLDLSSFLDTPLYSESVQVKEVIIYNKKVPLKHLNKLSVYGDRFVINEGLENEIVMPFKDTSAVSVLGRNKLNIYFGKTVYQIRYGKRFNALKYVNIYYSSKNIKSDGSDEKFLGL